MIKQQLKKIINNENSKLGKKFSWVIQVLIFLSVLTFSLETLPNLKPSTAHLLCVIETISIIIFTIEYILRIYVADNKLRFIFSFYGIIDFLAIFPFYFTLGVDLISLRILRFLRLFRLLKLARYNKAILHFIKALKLAKEEIILFFTITLILIYISAVGIYYFEHQAQPEKFASVFDSLWWAIVTLTTVGYGDVYPITVGGKIFTFIILLIGLGIVAVPTAIISSSLTRTFDKKTR